jgi:hypothetical protein
MVDTGVDQFFGSANDLVVPSGAGGSLDPAWRYRRIGCYARGNLTQIPSPVNFFSRSETVDFLARAIRRATTAEA